MGNESAVGSEERLQEVCRKLKTGAGIKARLCQTRLPVHNVWIQLKSIPRIINKLQLRTHLSYLSEPYPSRFNNSHCSHRMPALLHAASANTGPSPP